VEINTSHTSGKGALLNIQHSVRWRADIEEVVYYGKDLHIGGSGKCKPKEMKIGRRRLDYDNPAAVKVFGRKEHFTTCSLQKKTSD
jgi:hypothetical protein